MLSVLSLRAASLIQQVDGLFVVVVLVGLEDQIVAVYGHFEAVIFTVVGADRQRDRPDIKRLTGSNCREGTECSCLE